MSDIIQSPYLKTFKGVQESIPSLAAGKTTLFDVPARQNTRLAESIFWNRFLGSLNVYKFGLSSQKGMDIYFTSY
jgi:hypothetical protein